MKTTDKLAINVPFQGFYYSLYDQAVDAEFDQTVDGIVEDAGLDASDIGDALRRHCRFNVAYTEIAKKYLDAVNTVITEEIGFNPEIEWEEMTSPKEYNFETDRIFGKITGAKLKELLKACDKAELDAIIHDRFTSRSGFMSFYPNSLAEWTKKPISAWDHNQLGTVLLCVLGRIDDWENVFFDETQRGDVFSQAFDNCVDWPAFDADIETLKNGKD